MEKIDFSNMNTESRDILKIAKTRKKKEDKANKRFCIYLTEEQAEKLTTQADLKHLSIKDYILQKTIYA